AAFFADVASDWERTRDALYGARTELHLLASLASPTWVVGDLGCGTGSLSATLAPHVARVIAVDASAAMLEAARVRTASLPNVEVRDGTLEALPIADATLDLAICALVLHHVAEPLGVLRDARRVLRDGGRLLVLDMRAHAREEYRHQMGHVWLGFDSAALQQWCTQAGFSNVRQVDLPADPTVSGPALFALTATACASDGRTRSLQDPL
nr:class I SAM-dependent methyltransferase [Gemmatimonadaceae bacterium]